LVRFLLFRQSKQLRSAAKQCTIRGEFGCARLRVG
jgi:hypothetical protein